MADVIKYVSNENLKYYDGKIKKHITDADAALQAALEGQLEIVGGALDAEIDRAKKAEQSNATAAENAQGAADKAQGDVDALAEKVGTVEDGKTVMGIIAQIQADAYDDSELRGLIDGLNTNKADKTQVATDIADAVKAEEDARKEAVAGVQGAVDGLAQTHATDKSTLEGAIALKADITALNAVSDVANAAVKQSDYDVKVKALEDEDTRVAGLVATEKSRAEGIEAGLDERLTEVEAFFKTTEGEKLDEALDTLVELQKYLGDEGAVADQMLLDIAANAKAISDHAAIDHDFAAADATLKDELTAEINKKADKTTVEAMDTAYKAADTALSGRLDALEAINHEAYISADTALKNELNGEIAKKADQTAVDTLAQDSHTHGNKALLDTYTQTEANLADAVAKKHAHANAEELAKIANGDVAKWNAAEQNAKTHADNLNTAMTTRVDQLVETVAGKALASDLTTLAGRVTAEEGKSANFESRIAANEAFIAGIEFMSTTDIDNLFVQA